ncbi:MAG: hypothetical protein HUU10_03875 [Bacteroidetes bacterium]|nr:hypothetical protein [Bacteroidota bacterium]
MYNPVADIISDDLFSRLRELGLINEKGIRDLLIKQRFRELRKRMPASEVIESLRNEYPYLQYDTIRKIVYQVRPRAQKF